MYGTRTFLTETEVNLFHTLHLLDKKLWWVSFVTRCTLYAVQWRVFSTKEAYHHCGGGYLVWMCHTINTEEAYYQCGGGWAVQDHQNCSGGSWWLYISGKMIFYG